MGQVYEIVDFGPGDEFYRERELWKGIKCKCLDFDFRKGENDFYFGHFNSDDFPGVWKGSNVCFAYVKLRSWEISFDSYRAGDWIT